MKCPVCVVGLNLRNKNLPADKRKAEVFNSTLGLRSDNADWLMRHRNKYMKIFEFRIGIV